MSLWAVYKNSTLGKFEKWDKNELTFEPACPRSTYDMQLRVMRDYMSILEMRAVMEGIELGTSVSKE